MSNLDEIFYKMERNDDLDFSPIPCLENQTEYQKVFSFENLYKSAIKCLRGVRWKASIQNVEYKLLSIVTQLKNDLDNKTFKSNGFREFSITERGKTRRILSVDIKERIVQKCLCDYCLVPKLIPSFIYDNPSCVKGKGLSFALKRVKEHLHKFSLQHGNNGYIVLFDVKSYFDSINKGILLKKVRPRLDPELFEIYSYFVNNFPDDIGIGLGSQISEISALFYLSSLDHRMKDKERFKYYARYMDDGYCIVETKEEAKRVVEILNEELTRVKLHLHPRKTVIQPLNKEFVYLKRKFTLREDKTLLISPHKSTVLRYKRKRKKLVKKGVEQEKIEIVDTCFKAYLKEFNSYVPNKTRTCDINR